MVEVTAPPRLRLAESAVTVTPLTLFDASNVKAKVTLVNVTAPPRRLPE